MRVDHQPWILTIDLIVVNLTVLTTYLTDTEMF